ncbi:MAG: TonB-dependent siderophore receptor [Gammaproteobacteria bacterium]|nr:MAG: TonB-dependent siderophore receptor [Gammaproteobacteria bacterium]
MKFSRLPLSAAISLATLLSLTTVTAVAQTAESADANAPEKQLKAVKVTADALEGDVTEGTGSYTAGATKTATGLNLSIRETPQAVTVITRDRMEDQGLQSISEVLDQAVGVNFNGTSALGSDGIAFYARGFEIKNFQIDGTPRPPGIYGFSETTTDMALYDRVEIVRGSNGLMSGAGSPAASINLVRKRPTVDNQVSITAQVGSDDHYRVEADASGALTDNVRARLVATYQDSDSFVDRANITKKLVYGIVEADLTDNTLLTLGAEYQDFRNTGASRGGLPLFYADGSHTDFSRSTNSGANWSDFQHQTTRIFASVEHFFNNDWSIKLEGEQSRPDYDETIGYLYTSGFDPATSAGANMLSSRWAGDLEQKIISLSASGPFTLFGREHQLMAGLSHSTAEDSGDTYPGWWAGPAYWAPISNVWNFFDTGDYPKPDLGPDGYRYGGRIKQDSAYLATRLKPADAVSVILGTRVTDWKETEWDTYSGNKSSKTLTSETGVITPYAGIVIDFGKQYSLYASYADIFEAQSSEDLNGNRLPPLEGVNYEVGIKGEFNDGRLNASAAVFRIEQDNLAVAIPGAPLNPHGQAPYRAESGTVSQGFELEVAGELSKGWQVGGGYAHAKPKDSEGEPLLTEISKDNFKLFSTYKLSGDWQALTLGGNLRWQGKSYSEGSGPNGEDYNRDAITLVDLMAKYAVTENLSLTLNANNIFDKEYYSGFNYSSGTYGSPRSLMLTARYKL